MGKKLDSEFKGLWDAMYEDKITSSEQHQDIEKAFYAGMAIMLKEMTSLDDDKDIALIQVNELREEILSKMEELTSV